MPKALEVEFISGVGEVLRNGSKLVKMDMIIVREIIVPRIYIII